ncbi:Mitogen-activated protein kinase kinase kinase 11 [Coccomyxa sp. Obi]|nr:Mitogen-activated protein kinase kinase kinase 11 [Coccomyxa sp. Obi]
MKSTETASVPPPKQPVFPEPKEAENIVLMHSMRFEALSTPFDTAYNTVQPVCEFQSLPLPASTALPPLGPSATALSEPAPATTHDTPSAFGLTDPVSMDDYSSWKAGNTRGSTAGSGRGSGTGSTKSENLDALLGLAEKLRARSSSATQESLPELGAVLGRGSFGKVYKGRWKGAMVAVKIIEHSADENSKIEGFRENLVCSNIQHPNVLITYKVITLGQHGKVTGQPGSLDSARGSSGHAPQVAGVAPTGSGSAPHAQPSGDFEEVHETWLLSEFCDKGNLDRAVSGGRFHDKATGAPEMMAIYRCLLDIAAGMDYLHSLGVLHGDLKGGNVLMKSTSMYDDPRGFVCKIGDFGLSRVLDCNSTHVSTGTYGTVSYCSPELLKDGKLTKSADVYSFAMMMWEIYTGTHLFRGLNSSQVFFKVLMGYRPPVPPDMPEAYKDLMTACWDENPANRPPFCDIERYIRSMYYNSGDGKPRDSRRSLELNPWG